MRREFFVFLIAAAAAAAVCFGAVTTADSSDANPSGQCGENLHWMFDPQKGALEIYGEGDMYTDWGEGGTPWDRYIWDIRAVYLDGVTSIGPYAFDGCTGLKMIYIPGGVTQIYPNAFTGCESLETVILPSTLSTDVPTFSTDTNWFGGCYEGITVCNNSDYPVAAGNYGLPDTAKIVDPLAYTISVDFYDGSSRYVMKFEELGEKYDLPIEPVKERYIFQGWFTQSGGKGTQVTEETTVTQDDETILYAYWKASVIAVIFVDGSSAAKTIDETVGKTYSLPDPAPSREGLEFMGWFNAAGDEITADTVVGDADDTVLYAGWGIAVTFMNGGSEAETIDETIGKKYTLPDPAPSREGLEFIGWFNAAGDEITAKTVVGDTDDTVLYAGWSIAVTFMNGGSALKTIDETVGEKYTLPDPAPSREGLKFIGWFNASGSEVTADTVVGDTDDTVLNAAWARTVTFMNGGSAVKSIDETVGGTYILPADPSPPGEGLKFMGWFNAAGDEVTAETAVAETDDTVLNAGWGITVVFVDGGSMTDIIDERVGGTYTFPDPAPSREGLKFIGWFNAAGDEITAETTVAETDDTVLNAGWGITVTFMDGGSAVKTIDERVGGTYTLPAEPFREGLKFMGWFNAEGDEVTAETQVAETDDTVLHAVWGITVVFADGSSAAKTIDETIGGKYTLPYPAPSREGLKFMGWFNAAGDEITAETTVAETDDTVLNAAWARVVTFMNGSSAVKTIDEIVGENYVLPDPAPSREGLKFMGWFNAAGDEVTAETQVAETDDTILNAVWARTVTFTDGGKKIDTIDETVGGTYVLPDPEPSREGLKFMGWFNAAGDEITDETPVAETDDTALNAVWARTVTFTDGGSEVKTIDEIVGGRYILPDSDPSREGYTFGGWFPDRGGKGVRVTDTTIVAADDAAALYAMWTFEVTFTDGNTKTVETETVDLAYVLPGKPSREGYTFGGWFTEVGGEGSQVYEFTVVTFDDTTDLYAKWTFGVVLVDGDTLMSVSQTVDLVYVLPGDPSREGYTFGGWFPDRGGKGVQVTDTTAVTFDDTAVLYAKWTFDVTFIDGDTEIGIAETETVDLVYVLPNDPSREGYTFGGWFTEVGGEGVQVTGETVAGLGDAGELYAMWTGTVVFDGHGGIFEGGGTSVTASPVYGRTFELTGEPALTGYHVEKWTAGEDGSGYSFRSGDVWGSVDAVGMYAQWAANDYTVTFDANGGTLSGDPTAKARYDSRFTFGQSASRSGYSFEGWYTSASGGEKVSGGDVWKSDSDAVLYAHWEKVHDIVWYIAVGAVIASVVIYVVSLTAYSFRRP